MDERIPPILTTIAGSDGEPASTAVPPSDQLNSQFVTVDADATVVYCGDAESVREGFLLALGLMQASSNLLTPDAAPPAGNHQEDS
jgi:hypothetical protein